MVKISFQAHFVEGKGFGVSVIAHVVKGTGYRAYSAGGGGVERYLMCLLMSSPFVSGIRKVNQG